MDCPTPGPRERGWRHGPAVAENQPQTTCRQKNRMIERLSINGYVARARAFIETCAAGFLSFRETGREPEFNALALELFELQFRGNMPYRQWCQARETTPASVRSWEQIPVVPTAAFKCSEFTLLGAKERTRVFHSSGTTAGQRSRHFHHGGTLALYEASLLPWFARHLLGSGGLRGTPVKRRMIVLTPEPSQVPHSSLVWMLERAVATHGSADCAWTGGVDARQGWTLDFPAARRAFDAAREACEPVLVLGTAFSFVHLLDHLAAQGIAWVLPPGSLVMETGGYKGRSRTLPQSELHREIARALGVTRGQIVREYGMCELSSQAYASSAAAAAVPAPGRTTPGEPAEGVFHFPPWTRVRIVSPENGMPVGAGEPGLIQVFDLANVSSAMAVQTEDLGQPAGPGFVLLGRLTDAEERGCSLMAV